MGAPYNAKGDGSTDDTASINLAIAAAVAAGRGNIFFPPPPVAYKFTNLTPINIPGISFIGAGSNAVKLNCVATTGDAIRFQMSPFTNLLFPGRIEGLTVDGTGASAGVCGLHYGDAVGGQLSDLFVANFTGVGSKGIWMDNRTNWCERTRWERVTTYHNTMNILFDVNGGNISFAHTIMDDVRMDISPPNPSVGMRLQGGCALVQSIIHLTGNADTGATIIDLLAGVNFGYANGSNDFSITFETPSGCTGLQMAATSALFGAGVIDLALGGITSTNAGSGNIQFSGRFNCPGLWTPAGEGLVAMQGIAIPTGDLSIPTGGGAIRMGTAGSKLVPGATSFSVRNHADGADNLLIDDSGNGTFRANVQSGFHTDAANTGNYLQMPAANSDTQVVSRGTGRFVINPKATLNSDMLLATAPRILTTGTVPTVGSGGAGTSALSILANSTNTSGRFQVTLTAVAPGVVAGIVAFGGAPLATAPLNVVCSLSAPTAGVASPPIVGADTYTTSGFTVRVIGPTTVTTGTYVINFWVSF